MEKGRWVFLFRARSIAYRSLSISSDYIVYSLFKSVRQDGGLKVKVS